MGEVFVVVADGLFEAVLEVLDLDDEMCGLGPAADPLDLLEFNLMLVEFFLDLSE